MEHAPSPYPLFIETELKREPASVVRLLECVLRHALSLRASDVHFHPREDRLAVRFRIDGMLSEAYQFPLRLQRELLARIKILGSLRIDEQQSPQDGRFRFESDSDTAIDVRVSVTPSYFGENAVLRLLTNQAALASLESLGFAEDHHKLILDTLEQPHGLILISGPTGSGKTSTLYTLLRQLLAQEISIVTIEDPVEYSVPGITQIQTNAAAGFTFAEGLRSILRQDPNVIGIGEIRDRETAELAVHAALTGHLVLSTIHASDAVTVLPRLTHMGIEPYLLGSTLRLVVAQRLARTLCNACKEELPISAEYRMSRFLTPGCETCNFLGFSGRTGVFELLAPDSSVRELIAAGASTSVIRAKAETRGMRSLYEDARAKARAGLISAEESKTFLHA